MPGYAICAESSSASAFLCRLLTSTGVLGRPAAFFDAAAGPIAQAGGDHPAQTEAQLALIPTLGATPNGVYGLCVSVAQFVAAKSSRWTQRLPGLSFIHLDHHDLLACAIAEVRAAGARLALSQGLMGPYEPSPFAYDRQAIEAALIRRVRAQAQWRYYFARNGVAALSLVHEQVVSQPQAAVAAVGRLMGLAQIPCVDVGQIEARGDHDDRLDQAWRARFVADTRDLGEFR
jgi:LPS sulfotransferase NodH